MSVYFIAKLQGYWRIGRVARRPEAMTLKFRIQVAHKNFITILFMGVRVITRQFMNWNWGSWGVEYDVQPGHIYFFIVI